MTMLQALPDTPDRAPREVMHLMATALSMHSVLGYAARSSRPLRARAHECAIASASIRAVRRRHRHQRVSLHARRTPPQRS
jgi:hypothetical protein